MLWTILLTSTVFAKISPSLGYVTVRGEGKMERTMGEKTSYEWSLPFHRTAAG
jgi:hypothetical protein